MEIKSSKILQILKRYGVIAVACVMCLVVALVIGLNVSTDEEPVSTSALKFSVPMENAVVVKDFADDHLQFNESLNRWEIHLSVDMLAENSDVFSVCDGVVTSVETNSLDGYVVEISHSDGFVSVYSSLSDDVQVSVGDKVTSGQKIGTADKSASNELKTGSHLHFTLLQNGQEVDPNNYLDLQNK
jgi:murein DD-endopeptidase MepM/ murein hydrolase activator NlpD